MKSTRWNGLWSLVGALGALFTSTATIGCYDDAFCFNDCVGDVGSGSGTGATGAGGNGGGKGQGGDCIFNCGEGGAAGVGGSCVQSNGGIEICDKLDNDCNSTVDDIVDLDLASAKSCGTCDNNCYALVTNWDPQTVLCAPSPKPGVDPGTCSGTCDTDYYDVNGDGSCEYYCIKNAPDDAACNKKDDDCDGAVDEDVDLCTSPNDCGKCGRTCVVLNGAPKCEHTGMDACDPSNTACGIFACNCTGPNDCWHDADGSYVTGCEYKCDTSNNGVEICDGLDNDCDGKIDAADDLTGDLMVGAACAGDPDGECATPAHAGKNVCQGGQIVCQGGNVIKENDILETCNGKDDDCDGAVDDSPTDAGTFCGASNIAPCSYGTKQCQGGALTCVGEVPPKMETCNGIDDDCDGTVDKMGAMSPPDSIGACDVPVMPPVGATSPCKAGMKACVGGVVTCQGSAGPSSLTDGCNIDANCDGQLTNQPSVMTDVANCGACGNSCYAGAVHSNWSCQGGQCVYGGCQSGYYDLNNDQQCEYGCIFISAQESCNGADDNCNGIIDENIPSVPSPTQVCGVSPTATSPACTTGVSVACMAGAWKCTFPANVCNPSCATASEVCDTLDNDCDGVVNENVSNYNKPCASDDATPVPGHGACRTTGLFVCNGPGATMCNAVKADCNALPAGCTEKCDGVDNDCDGLTDETFNAKGTNATNFVKPAVTKIAATTWIYSYEASRPSANAATNSPGSGNGYFTSAPAGETIDKTPACSVPGQIPWFNVSPIEVEQTCTAMGGSICTTASWQTACASTGSCTWGYAPAGAACTSTYSASKYCNLGPSYDFPFPAPLAGDQDGLLPTASPLLQTCWAEWGAAGKIFDITGNLREITKSGVNAYPLGGGAFNTADPNGATCGFTFYTVDQNFKLFDAGFRCCFSADPTL